MSSLDMSLEAEGSEKLEPDAGWEEVGCVDLGWDGPVTRCSVIRELGQSRIWLGGGDPGRHKQGLLAYLW